jgi:hypothetical protein
MFSIPSPCRSRFSESPVKSKFRASGRSSVLDGTGFDSFFINDTYHMLSPAASAAQSPTRGRVLPDVEEEETATGDDGEFLGDGTMEEVQNGGQPLLESSPAPQPATNRSSLLFSIATPKVYSDQPQFFPSPEVQKQDQWKESMQRVEELTQHLHRRDEAEQGQWKDKMQRLEELTQHLHRREEAVSVREMEQKDQLCRREEAVLLREKAQSQKAVTLQRQQIFFAQEKQRLKVSQQELDEQRRETLLQHVHAADQELMCREERLSEREGELSRGQQDLEDKKSELETKSSEFALLQEDQRKAMAKGEAELKVREARVVIREQVRRRTVSTQTPIWKDQTRHNRFHARRMLTCISPVLLLLIILEILRRKGYWNWVSIQSSLLRSSAFIAKPMRLALPSPESQPTSSATSSGFGTADTGVFRQGCTQDASAPGSIIAKLFDAGPFRRIAGGFVAILMYFWNPYIG